MSGVGGLGNWVDAHRGRSYLRVRRWRWRKECAQMHAQIARARILAASAQRKPALAWGGAVGSALTRIYVSVHMLCRHACLRECAGACVCARECKKV